MISEEMFYHPYSFKGDQEVADIIHILFSHSGDIKVSSDGEWEIISSDTKDLLIQIFCRLYLGQGFTLRPTIEPTSILEKD